MTASSSAATLDRLAREKERHMPMHRSSRGRRRVRFALTVQLVVTLAVLLAAGQAAAVPLERGTAGSSKAKPLDKVERRVLDQTAAKGAATFFVVLRDRADLAPATKLSRHRDRTAAVYQRLRDHADRSQARLRQLLRASKVDYKPFWIANAVRVTAGPKLLEKIAALPEVERVVAERRVQLPKPTPAQERARIQTIEWNIDRIRAPEVWSTFGDRGDGIVVANVDTGVSFDHPALVRQYRGNLGGGAFDHNYNWVDPSEVCGSPSLVPCDNNGHGTHTMGTMVGDDGDPGTNQVGVAPHARWIAAKGCETNSCSDSALLGSGQWILAPTDLTGQNPRPDLAPHIVNNSWGGGPGDPFYQAIVDAWNAAGIFPAFSNGNAGPGCGSAGSPGDFLNTYAAGAFDINNAIADFSSRGPSAFGGELKPNVAAPGVDVRSSVPGGGYEAFNGTSMASPHVAGTVALMWSAAPSLVGDIALTRQLLDDSAVDTEDLSCGGTADDNNVWGEGRLDAFVAVDISPRGPTGTLAGTVTDQSTGSPIEGAAVHAVGPTDRTTFTGPDGTYSIVLPVGTYDVTASHFGFVSETASGVTVTEGATTTQDFALTPAPSHSVSGHVRDGDGNPLAGATVTIEGTPLPPATTDADGFYSFASVPEGEYDVTASAGGCYETQTQHLVVDGDETLDFTLPQRHDNFGYSCQATGFEFVDANTVLPLSGDDNSIQIDLPFSFTFYGTTYTSTNVTTNGFLSFVSSIPIFANGPIPSADEPNGAIYAFWDDLIVDGAASVRTEVLGSAPNRSFVIEWDNVAFFADTSKRVNFEAILTETGRITYQYQGIDDDGMEEGNSATIGIENAAGDDALQYSFNQAAVSNGTAILFSLPPSAFVEGTVTDANDGQPIAGATIRALQDGTVVRETTTDADGHYRTQLPLGTYTIEASATNYSTETAEVVLDQENEVVTQDFSLRAARAEVTPEALEFIVPPGEQRSQTLTLTNTGTLDLVWEAQEVLVAAGTNAGKVQQLAKGVDSRTAPKDYKPTLTKSVLQGEPVLVFQDALPWGSDALTQVLTANGIPFDTANSSQMGTIDLSAYKVVFFASDQPPGFYSSYGANRARFEDYVQTGGFLWVGAAAWGFNGGDFNGGVLPGGATVVGPVFEDANDVVDNAHPTMQLVPDPFTGTFASHAAFDNLPAGANVIADGQAGGQPTLVEYDLGAGRVLAFGQTLEFAWANGQDGARILENGVPYAYAFEPVVDVPWLSENPSSGTLAPGASQDITVTVDTTGLAPGFYRARIIIRSNDPRNPRLQVPVSLIVPAYRVGANAGGGNYVDTNGDTWLADRAFTAGSWGYLGASSVMTSNRPISGTDDDPLYQNLRRSMFAYRFDGLAPGVYQVELRFAELRRVRPNTRLFDVVLENTLVLPAHDIALEVGSFAADDHSFFIRVTDGTLDVRLIERAGFDRPIINAVRVTSRPDQE
jgi:subtilisin family serine protease